MDIRDGERLDEIGFGGLKLIQKPQDFCYGVDAVLLADFAASIAKKKLAIIHIIVHILRIKAGTYDLQPGVL